MGAITKLAAESGDMVIRVVGNTDTELRALPKRLNSNKGT